MIKPLLIILFFSQLFWISCVGRNNGDNTKNTDSQELKEQLLLANTYLIDAEDQEIKDFIARNGWIVEHTGSGLRYMIYETGKGRNTENNKTAVFHYTISLITGDIIYSSREKNQPGEFLIGKGGVESGLEEGILLLRVGDKAKLILPSHLAHGVPGDGLKIPSRATIIYDIELIALRD